MHKDKLGNVIYVGKAINLKRRISSYFVNSASHSQKVRAMVRQVEEFEYITCRTEMEALILECNLIKKYEPKYNVLLRDDKTYPYLKITLNEDYPRLVKTRAILRDVPDISDRIRTWARSTWLWNSSTRCSGSSAAHPGVFLKVSSLASIII